MCVCGGLTAHTREVSKAMVESCQFREVPSQGIVIRGEICACMCVFVPLCVCVSEMYFFF